MYLFIQKWHLQNPKMRVAAIKPLSGHNERCKNIFAAKFHTQDWIPTREAVASKTLFLDFRFWASFFGQWEVFPYLGRKKIVGDEWRSCTENFNQISWYLYHRQVKTQMCNEGMLRSGLPNFCRGGDLSESFRTMLISCSKSAFKKTCAIGVNFNHVC